jgi:hypothetical protein
MVMAEGKFCLGVSRLAHDLSVNVVTDSPQDAVTTAQELMLDKVFVGVPDATSPAPIKGPSRPSLCRSRPEAFRPSESKSRARRRDACQHVDPASGGA